MKLKKKKLREQKSRLSLTLLFAGAVFAILLAVLLVVGGASLLMIRTGLMPGTDVGMVNGYQLVGLMLIVSVVLGCAFSFLFGRLFVMPINSTINVMNRIATGDFHARISFTTVFSKVPIISELTDSINTMAGDLENTELLRLDFVNNFSHEFKTPIVSIAGFAKLMRSGDLTEEQQQEYLAIIEEESLRLSAMATNVLSLTRVENQTILTDITSFNLSEQIRSCFLILEDKWTQKALDLVLDFGEYEISANEELLRQVWINLIDNAVKFTPYGGTIGVRIAAGAGTVSVTVENTGSSIAPENTRRIFQKFYQEDRSHSSPGNGVGLAVVKRVVDLHHGLVWVRSENDVTAFTVKLPVEQ